MKLQKFRVEGFRCLSSIDWILLSKFTIFTGQNDGGKTSALDALRIFLDRRVRVEENDFTFLDENNKCDQVNIEGIFSLSQTEQTKLGWDAANIHIKSVRKKDNTLLYFYKTKVHPDQRLQRDLNTVTIDELKQIADDHNIALSTRRAKEPIIQEIRNWLKTQALEEGFLELPAAFIGEFPIVKLFRSAKTLDPENEINQTLTESFSTRIQTEKYSGRLSTIQNEIEEEMKGDLRDFEVIVRTYCPDVASIDIDPYFDFTHGFRTSKLKLKKPDSAPIDLSKEGEGRKRRITLAVYEWREKILSEPEPGGNERQMIVAFDEPDTHLDYVSQRKILDIIKRISEKNRNSVIVCTHSLNLIDRVPITDIVHFKKDADRTLIETLKTEDPELVDVFLYEISDCMGLKNSIMLNERCFLAVEGETEIHSLPILFKKLRGFSLQAGGIRLINGEGCGGVRSLAKFLNNNRRNVIFLLDRDSKDNPNSVFTPDKLRADGFNIEEQVFFVGTKEYEDAFSDEVYERAAATYWPKHDQSPWSRQEFSVLRTLDNFCDELVKLVRRNTHTNMSKPEIGLSVAKAINTTEIPKEIVACLDEASRLSI
jgi:predicted ATP-dependent endonuclease of OLD family